jgi:hypothetical protein
MLLHIIKKEKDLDGDSESTSTLDETISKNIIIIINSFFFENESEIYHFNDENV